MRRFFLFGLVRPARLRMLPKVLAAGRFTSGSSISSRALSLRAPHDGCLLRKAKIRAKQKLPVGKVKIEIVTAYAVPKPGGALNITMKVNGEVAATGQVPISAPLLFTANDCLDIGIAHGSPVSLDYFDKMPFKFSGTIEQVHMEYVIAKKEPVATAQ